MSGIAPALAYALSPVIPELPVRLIASDGSAACRGGRMGVDQILSVRPGAAHTLPSVRGW